MQAVRKAGYGNMLEMDANKKASEITFFGKNENKIKNKKKGRKENKILFQC